jgi:dGTPase
LPEKVKYKLSAPVRFFSRQYKEPYAPLPYRNEFQRDRDRILYSKEFRRLSGKTQVFLPASHDHVRTRLTHTLEVSQISRVTANNLGLEPALAEAIALGHDVGHTPFGHVGERTLSLIMSNCDRLANFQNLMISRDQGFKHNLQSLRVACDLEQLYGNPGLNLTNFTLWGIKHHTKDNWGHAIISMKRIKIVC